MSLQKRLFCFYCHTSCNWTQLHPHLADQVLSVSVGHNAMLVDSAILTFCSVFRWSEPIAWYKLKAMHSQMGACMRKCTNENLNRQPSCSKDVSSFQCDISVFQHLSSFHWGKRNQTTETFKGRKYPFLPKVKFFPSNTLFYLFWLSHESAKMH